MAAIAGAAWSAAWSRRGSGPRPMANGVSMQPWSLATANGGMPGWCSGAAIGASAGQQWPPAPHAWLRLAAATGSAR